MQLHGRAQLRQRRGAQPSHRRRVARHRVRSLRQGEALGSVRRGSRPSHGGLGVLGLLRLQRPDRLHSPGSRGARARPDPPTEGSESEAGKAEAPRTAIPRARVRHASLLQVQDHEPDLQLALFDPARRWAHALQAWLSHQDHGPGRPVPRWLSGARQRGARRLAGTVEGPAARGVPRGERGHGAGDPGPDRARLAPLPSGSGTRIWKQPGSVKRQ